MTMKKTIKDIKTLHTAFKLLNGRDEVVESDGKKRTVFVPFQFTGGAAYQIAKNLNILRRPLKKAEEDLQALATTLGIDKEMDKTLAAEAREKELERRKDAFKQFAEASEAADKEEVELTGLLPVKISTLGLDANPIQPGVLCDLEAHDLLKE